MRTTIEIDDGLLADARELSGVAESAVLVSLALRSYLELEASWGLAAQGGRAPVARGVPQHGSKRE